MTELQIGVIGFLLLGIFIYAGLHISTALLTVTFLGVWLIRGDITVAGNMLGIAATDAVAEYEFGTVPLFVLMGLLVMVSGVGADSYRVAHRALRRLPGGLGHATVAGNALFSAITGITVAAVVMFSKLAVPEMIKRGYHPRLAVGVVAGSAMLGMLIPPSILMIIYAVLTEISIADIYNAGIVPGVILAVAFSAAIWLVAIARPDWVGSQSRGAAGPPDADERSLASQTVPIVALIVLVLGGMYGGVFTATEASAFGAAGALVIAALRRSLDIRTFWTILIDTGYITASLILIIASAVMFSRFLAMSGIPTFLVGWVQGMHLGLTSVMLIYVVVVLALGTALDSTSTVLIAVPVFAPILKQLGGDLVWVGIVTMIAVEVGLITPPLGLSPFCVRASLANEEFGRTISLHDIYVGALPFAAAALLVIALLIAFPKLALLMV
ncbi:MAG: TRAP transporter large permease [Tepidisphaeraceae bacterium]